MKHGLRETSAIRAENVRVVNKPLTETYSKQGSITLADTKKSSERDALARRADSRKRPASKRA